MECFRLRLLLTMSPHLCPGKPNSLPSLSNSSASVLPGARLLWLCGISSLRLPQVRSPVHQLTSGASCRAKHLICVSATGFTFTACSSTLCLSTTMLLPAASKCACSACLPVAHPALALTTSPACSSTVPPSQAPGCGLPYAPNSLLALRWQKHCLSSVINCKQI